MNLALVVVVFVCFCFYISLCTYDIPQGNLLALFRSKGLCQTLFKDRLCVYDAGNSQGP